MMRSDSFDYDFMEREPYSAIAIHRNGFDSYICSRCFRANFGRCKCKLFFQGALE